MYPSSTPLILFNLLLFKVPAQESLPPRALDIEIGGPELPHGASGPRSQYPKLTMSRTFHEPKNGPGKGLSDDVSQLHPLISFQFGSV